MLLQNTLDLSTFEIVRFRIWNQTSNPDDYGVGTKYFNTNSGHEGYNRENIYTATGWRRAAYMDDIEAITNGEGSLGTRVKALEDMLGLEDVTDVIDTWNDVKEFFANVDEGLNLMTMLDGKLDKTGGTINGTLTVASHFSVGETATIGGRLTMKGLIAFDQYNETGKTYLLGMTEEGGPLRWYNDSTWKTIAFTDSDITGYAAGLKHANGKVGAIVNSSGNVTIGDSDLAENDVKLYVQGASKISGVFDVNGGIVLGKNAYIGVTDSNDKRLYALRLNTSDNTHSLLLGQYTAKEGYDTLIYGNEIRLCYSNAGTSSLTALLVNSEGRVLVGGAEDDGESELQATRSIRVGDVKSNLLRTSITRGNTNYYGRSGGHILGSNFYSNDGSVLLATTSVLATDNALNYYFIGADALNTWFAINSTESNFNVLTKFNAGALIPTGQTLTIGSVTFRETAAGEVEVDGNLHTTGTLASGGKGEAGENTTGNAMVYQYDLASGESVYRVDNVKGSTNVIVQIFEWNSNTSSWDMILTDVSVKADAITVTFGRTTTVNHMVTVC